MTQPAETSSAQPNDGQLLAAFVQRREQAAFTQIVRRHGDMVWAVCTSVLGNGTDAQDAAQAVFMTLAQRASSLQGRATLAGWLHHVAWYVATRAAAAAAVRRQHEREAGRMNHQSQTLGPGAGADLPADHLHDGLSKLPEKYRLPLILHHLEGRSQEEVAVLLRLKTGTLSARLTRGRGMLRKRILKDGLAVSAAALTITLSAQASASVPASLASAITSTVSAVLAGKTATIGAASAQTLALSKGALHMLYVAKLKLAALYITAALVLGGGAMGGYVAAVGAAASPSTQGAATQPATFPPSAPEAILQQLRSVDAVYEAAFTATGTRLTASSVISEMPPLSKQWKITMADGKTAYEEQVVQVLKWEDIPWAKGDPSKPFRLNPRGETAPTASGIALKSIWLFEPTKQAEYDFVGSIPPAGKPLEYVEGRPSLGTAGSLSIDDPSAPTYVFELKRTLWTMGRGYSKHLTNITKVEKRDDGLLRVTAEGTDMANRQGARWELTIDPQAAYMVRSAQLYKADSKDPLISISNSGIRWENSRCIPRDASWEDHFVIGAKATSQFVSVSATADQEFLKQAEAAMLPPYPLHTDVSDQRMKTDLHLEYQAK